MNTCSHFAMMLQPFLLLEAYYSHLFYGCMKKPIMIMLLAIKSIGEKWHVFQPAILAKTAETNLYYTTDWLTVLPSPSFQCCFVNSYAFLFPDALATKLTNIVRGARGSIFLERVLHIEPIFWFVSKGFGEDCRLIRFPNPLFLFNLGQFIEFLVLHCCLIKSLDLLHVVKI